MNTWIEPYEDEYIKERIEELRTAQQEATQKGKTLVSSYEQFWLPCLNDLPDVEYEGRDHYTAPYGTFEAAPDTPFHGALWFTPQPGAEVPTSLKNLREWKAGVGVVDLNARMLKIQSDEVEVTFTSININQSAAELLHEINKERPKQATQNQVSLF